MSYIAYQRIRGRLYAYEAEGYWDPVKKQARQRRKYLGAVNEETGEIIPKKTQTQIHFSKSFGQYHVLHELAKQSGLEGRLRDAFGDDAALMLALAMVRVVDPTSMRNAHLALEESFVPEMLGLEQLPTSQRMSEFMSSLAAREGDMLAYFRANAKKEDALIFDITCLSSYSKQLPFLEYGADFRETGRPQINLGLVVSLEQRLPIYYKIFPGSITDVVTLNNLAAEVRDLGVGRCLFILDRGFYSVSNVRQMHDRGIDFLIPIPFNRTEAKTLISESNQLLDDPGTAGMLDDELYFVHETTQMVGDVQTKAFVILSEKRMAEEKRTLFARLESLENEFNGQPWHPGIPGELADWAGKLDTCLEAVEEQGKVAVRRKRNAISQLANRCGKMILLTSRDVQWKEALMTYRQRDEAEQDFGQLKGDIDIMPLGVSSMASLRGLAFILFISLQLRSLLLQRARKAKLLGKMWVEEMLRILGMLKVTRIAQVWRLNEVTKKQRELCSALGVKALALPDLVTK